MRKYLALLCSLLVFNLGKGEEINVGKTTTEKGEAEIVNSDYIGKNLSGEKNIIREIEVTNNKEVPTDVILSLISLKVGESFSGDALFKDYNKLKKEEYIDNISMYPKSQDGGVKIVIVVDEKKDVKKILQGKGILPNSEREYLDATLVVSNVNIEGIKNLKQEELLALLSTKTGGYLSERRVINDQRALIETGKFQNVTYEVIENAKGATVNFKVIENPILNGINIIGNTKYTTEELMSLMGTKPGEVFSIKTIREDREKILNKYYDAGFILADIIDIDINSNLELEFVISEGIAREIGFRKMITKNRGQRRKPNDDVMKTKDFVVEREIEIKQDEVFSNKDYDETSANLMRTGVFKNVKYEANQIPGDPDGKSVLLLLEEERTASLQGAVSYGSEEGLMGMVALKDENWDGRDQEASIQFEQSDEGYSSFSVNFYDPWIEGTERLSWGWSLYVTETEDDDSYLYHEIKKYGGKITAGKGLSKFVRVGVGTKLEYIVEENEDGDETDSYFQESLYPYITYDTRNNPMNPTRGEYGKFQVEGGYSGGEDADMFGNTTIEGRKYHRGFTRNNTMAYRLVGGIMTDSTKESQTFWVGGNSLRGYDGGTFKGREKLVGTVENRTQINDIVGFVVFYDVGRAWNQDPKDTYENDKDFAEQVAMSAGVGLRLNTPMGPLRFDFGWPVGEKIDGEEGMKFYFNMGQSF